MIRKTAANHSVPLKKGNNCATINTQKEKDFRERIKSVDITEDTMFSFVMRQSDICMELQKHCQKAPDLNRGMNGTRNLIKTCK